MSIQRSTVEGHAGWTRLSLLTGPRLHHQSRRCIRAWAKPLRAMTRPRCKFLL